ncbi:MAG: SIS domain-containing protein [bacterium]|nr:SIS domain-containing protein [bacterium]MDE0234560.1 SIS domain-containing protein [bacterium]
MTEPQTHAGSHGPGSSTSAEIASQPSLWPQAVEAGMSATALQHELTRGPTLYIGCGSSAHLARTLAYAHRQRLPTFAWAEAASEVWLAPDPQSPRAHTVVAISRSGETTETIEAARRARGLGSTLIEVTASPNSPLSEVCTESVVVDFAAEESVVQTRSFTSMLLAALAGQLTAADMDAAAVFAGIGETGAEVINAAPPVTEQLADLSLESVFVLGSGLSAQLAPEAALKIKEMSATFAEGFPVLDFRHGPISLAYQRTAALLLCGSSLAHELAVAADIEACGAHVFTVGPDPRCTIETLHGASEASTAVACLVVAQLAGLRRGLAKGLNPDAPLGVQAHVELNPGTGHTAHRR